MTIITGTPFFDGAGGVDTGRVRAWELSGGLWIQKGSTIEGASAGDLSGESVAVSADGLIIAAGAPGDATNGLDAGSVAIFLWTGTDYILMGTPILGTTGGKAGTAIALNDDGSMIAVGSPGHTLGAVDVYTSGGGPSWTQLGLTILDMDGTQDFWGDALALITNRVFIGSPESDINGVNTGQVAVYDWDGSFWVQAVVLLNGQTVGEKLGNSIARSIDGSRVAIGAANFNSQQGKVYIYQVVGWIPLGELTGVAVGDQFGTCDAG
jgi:hypothetical protein